MPLGDFVHPTPQSPSAPLAPLWRGERARLQERRFPCPWLTLNLGNCSLWVVQACWASHPSQLRASLLNSLAGFQASEEATAPAATITAPPPLLLRKCNYSKQPPPHLSRAIHTWN